MNNLKLFFILVVLYATTSAFSQTRDCNKLPQSFSSYEQAYQLITSTKFSLQENYSAFQSSWINGLSYHSCDGQKGYFIVYTNQGTYIHKGVPIKLWKGIKGASSKGSYYSKFIRGKFRL